MPSITGREQQEIDRANTAGLKTIVFVRSLAPIKQLEPLARAVRGEWVLGTGAGLAGRPRDGRRCQPQTEGFREEEN